MIDANVALGRWPFRRLPHDEPAALASLLRDRGVTEAWAGSLDALLHDDLAAVNARLADDCRAHGAGLFRPFGAVNPMLPGWLDDLDRIATVHRMPGIRLYPNYHGYTLADPELARLLEGAAARGLIVQVAAKMEDERTQHPLVRVPPVDLAPVPDLLGRIPKLRVVLLNALFDLKGEALRRVAGAGDVSVEIAMLEGAFGVENLIQFAGVDRVLFGSFTPVFVFEAAALKLVESPLTDGQRAAIGEGNARRLLGRV